MRTLVAVGLRLILLAAASLVVGCGTFEEPSPGRYVDLGQRTKAELICEYDAPTAMRITRLQCRRAEDMDEATRIARELLENNRVHQPRE